MKRRREGRLGEGLSRGRARRPRRPTAEVLEERRVPALSFGFDFSAIATVLPDPEKFQQMIFRAQSALRDVVPMERDATILVVLQPASEGSATALARPTKPKAPVRFPRLGWRESNFFDLREGTNGLGFSFSSLDVEVDVDQLANVWIDPEPPTSAADGVDFFTDLLRSTLMGVGFNGLGFESPPSEGAELVGGITIGTPFDKLTSAQGGEVSFLGPHVQDVVGAPASLAPSSAFETIATTFFATRADGSDEVTLDTEGETIPVLGYFLDAPGDLMDQNLPPGERRLPSELDRAILKDVGPKQADLIVAESSVGEAGGAFRARVAYAGPVPDLTAFFPDPLAGEQVTLRVTTEPGTAEEGVDYQFTPQSFTVDFAQLGVGGIAFDVDVPIIPDTLTEADETLTLVLTSDSQTPDDPDDDVEFARVVLTIVDEVDGTGPEVEELGPVVPNPRNTPLDGVDVRFSELVEESTFTAADVTLRRDGEDVPLDAGVTTALVAGTTYRISGLEGFTATDGEYVLTVDAAGLSDRVGNAGTGAASTTFVVDVTAPTITRVGPVAPDPRNTRVETLDVVFSEGLAPGSFTRADLSLRRDGQEVALDGAVTVALVSGSTYRISGLGAFTEQDGAYVLTVEAAGLADLAGNAATVSASDAFAVDGTGPTVTAVGSAAPDPSTGPVRTVDVTFSEAIDAATFTAADLSLTRNGTSVALGAGVTTALVSGTTYRVSGLGTLTAPNGAYVLTVNAAGVADALGNAGSGSETVDFRRGIVAADYDGDGQTDLATYEYDPTRDVGIFRIRPSSGSADLTIEIPQAGASSVPVPGDYDGDGRADPALVDPLARLDGSPTPNASVWIIRRSKFEGQANQTLRIPFGGAGVLDRPSPADFDGDGRTDIATFRADSDITPGAAQWFVLPSGPNPDYETTSGAFTVVFGAAGGVDLPAAFDFDGDGKADIATFRPVSDLVPGAAQWFVLPSGPNGVNFATKNNAFPVTFGAAGNADQPVVADWDGDGADDIAAFRSESDLVPGSSQWFILPTGPNQPNYATNNGGFPVTFGVAGEIAAVGDYTDDGRPDMAVFNAETGAWRIRGGFDGPEQAAVTFGGTGARVVPVIAPLFFRLRATGNIASGDARLVRSRVSRWPGIGTTDRPLGG